MTNIINQKKRRYDLTDQLNYEDAYPIGEFRADIEKVMDVPSIDDMAGVFLRSVIPNERKLNAAVRLYHRHIKFGDNEHQELLRVKLAGMAAIGGVGRLDALFTAVRLIASDMYRTARGMTKYKQKDGHEERVYRGSDFRDQERGNESLGVQQ